MEVGETMVLRKKSFLAERLMAKQHLSFIKRYDPYILQQIGILHCLSKVLSDLFLSG